MCSTSGRNSSMCPTATDLYDLYMNDYTGNECNIKEILYYSINHK